MAGDLGSLLDAAENWTSSTASWSKTTDSARGGTHGRLSNQRGRSSTLLKRLFDSATPGQPQHYAASLTSTRSR